MIKELLLQGTVLDQSTVPLTYCSCIQRTAAHQSTARVLFNVLMFSFKVLLVFIKVLFFHSIVMIYGDTERALWVNIHA